MPQSFNTAFNSSAVPPGLNPPQVDYQVSASPVGFQADTTELQQAQQLAQDMSAFTGQAERFTRGRSQEVIRNEQEKAVLDNLHSDKAQPAFTGEESAWYQQARMKLYGESMKNQAVGDLNEQVEKIREDPSKLNGQNPQQFLDTWFKKNVAGITDPDVAAAVYPALEQSVAAARDNIAKAQNVYMKRQVAGQAQDVINQMFADSEGQPRVPDSATFWAGIKAGIDAGVPKDQMMYYAAQRIQYAYTAENLKGAPDLFNTRSPEGVTFANSKEDQFKFKDVASSVTHMRRQEIVQEEYQAKQQLIEGQKQENQAVFIYAKANAAKGILQSDEELYASGLTVDQVATVKVEHDTAIHKQADRVAYSAVTADMKARGLRPDDLARPGYEEDHKVSVTATGQEWDNLLQGSLAKAQAQIAQGANASDVYDDKQGFRATLQYIGTEHANKASTVPLEFMATRVENVAMLPSMGQLGKDGKLPEKAALAFAIYQTYASDKNFDGMIPKIFKNQEDRVFMSTWVNLAEHTVGGMVPAYEAAKESMSSDNKANMTAFYTNPDEAKKKAASSVIAEFSHNQDTLVTIPGVKWAIPGGPLVASMDPSALEQTVREFLTRDRLAGYLAQTRGNEMKAHALALDDFKTNFQVYEGSALFPGLSWFGSNGDKATLVPSITAPGNKAIKTNLEAYSQHKGYGSLSQLGFQDSDWPKAVGLLQVAAEASLRSSSILPAHGDVTLIPRGDMKGFLVYHDGAIVPNIQFPLEAALEVWKMKSDQKGATKKAVEALPLNGDIMQGVGDLVKTQESARRNYVDSMRSAAGIPATPAPPVIPNPITPIADLPDYRKKTLKTPDKGEAFPLGVAPRPTKVQKERSQEPMHITDATPGSTPAPVIPGIPDSPGAKGTQRYSRPPAIPLALKQEFAAKGIKVQLPPK